MGLFDLSKKKKTTVFGARREKEITNEKAKQNDTHRVYMECAAPPQKTTSECPLSPDTKESGGRAYANHACADRATSSVTDSTPQKQAEDFPCDKNVKENALRILRERIINAIRKTPATTYELASLLWNDAATCFPTSYGFNWDGAWFKLNLLTKELYADVSTYPNQFGASREDRYRLSADGFHQKALEFHMSNELQCMETEADWQALFDADLTAAIDQAQSALKEQQEKQKQEQRIFHGLVIPDELAGITPTMDLDMVRLELHQRYGMSSVFLAQKEGKYLVVSSGNKRELSPLEAAWVERQVKDCLDNESQETWQSMAGGDYMSVKICTTDTVLVDLFYKVPFKKYYELKHQLQTLATYGSLSESEKKKVNP